MLRFTIESTKTYLLSTRAAKPLLRLMSYASSKKFDWTYKVDTCGITVSQSAGTRHVEYAGTHPKTISAMLRDLDLRHEDFVFIDLGSGKGRVLLGASEYPFKKIVGVEIDDKLHKVAVSNIRAYRNGAKRCYDIQSICRDAREYEFPIVSTVIYFFNPFGPEIADRVLNNLAKSLIDHPREIVIINLGARLEPSIARLEGIQLIKETQYHKIFKVPCFTAPVSKTL